MPRTFEQFATNEIFLFIARIMMMVSLPLGGFFGTRVIAQADKLEEAVVQEKIAIEILGVQVKDKSDAYVLQLSDHELRLRALEHSRQN
jgi:hypothetical protein